MSNRFEDLPIEIQDRVWSFVREHEDGTREVEDMRGLTAFVVENAEQYSSLLKLVNIDEDRVIQHAKETGEVPPG